MDIFVARQPIFNQKQEVYAYELLYRSGINTFYSCLDGDRATSEVITNSFLLIGLETLTRGKIAFINFTKNLLEDEVAMLLPKEHIVIEVLQDIEPDEKTLRACRKLKKMGYRLALDDFVYDDKFIPLIELADIIKVDFLITDEREREALVRRIGPQGISFLAEKVETREDFIQAREMGYSYFQGYFFSKPLIVTSRDIPSYKLTFIRILQEIHKPEINFDRLEKLIKTDVSLSYKLLKFINSLLFGFYSEIRSIKQALAVLGEREIRKWLSLIALKSMGRNKPDELMITALCRARFCELVASRVGLGDRSSDLFLLGMFSLIDAFLDQPMAKILAALPIAEEIKLALLGRENRFQEVYALTLTYETGKWEDFSRYAARLGLEERVAKNFYIQSLESSQKFFLRSVS
ncbi:MAG: HDOD domain-containing protein [Firmicutes bacterium]|nr:HDOD domain-containing protein [Bacillota bacterium]